jgi:GNAT superfamily N-acetyltransferase
MISPAEPARLPIHLECVSWHLVQHHLLHGALRLEPAAVRHIRLLRPTDDESHFCLATLADAPIAVLGLVHYRVTYDDLYFAYIRVREAYRHRGIGRRMLSEVVAHPTCIHLSRLHWAAGTNGGEALIRHLEWLRDNGRRLCGTPFQLIVDPACRPATSSSDRS